MQDIRIENGRVWLEANGHFSHTEVKIISDLVDFGDERLRVNVGLLSENEVLKRRVEALENGRQT